MLLDFDYQVDKHGLNWTNVGLKLDYVIIMSILTRLFELD